MSTRGVIMRASNPVPWGRYHHFDSYPMGLGATLWRLYHEQFGQNLTRMLKTLIDDHPAGWSTLVGRSFDFPPGFWQSPRRAGDPDKDLYEASPICYCHGDRAEDEEVILWPDLPESWIDYAYVFDVDAVEMWIFGVRYHNDPILLAQIPLHDPEPDWQAIQNRWD